MCTQGSLDSLNFCLSEAVCIVLKVLVFDIEMLCVNWAYRVSVGVQDF